MSRAKKPQSKNKKRKLSDNEVVDSPAPNEPTEAFIGSIEEAPQFVKDNLHITGGYRINFDTPRKIFKTLFMAHNQTVNIWSHLFGAILFVLVVIYAAFWISPDISSSAPQTKKFSFLDNSTVLKRVTDGADHKLHQIKASLSKVYEEFRNTTKERIQETDHTLHALRQKLEDKIHEVLLDFATAKEQFEHEGVTGIIEKVKTMGDDLHSPIISSFKDEIAYLSEEFIKMSDSKGADLFDPAHTPNPFFISRWPIFVFLWSAVFCLLCSAIFHLFYPMSGASYKIFLRFDYAGINVLISGSTFPPLYYGMYCNLNLAIFYLGLISAIAVTLFTVSVFEWIHRDENRKIKALLFAGFGMFLLVPAMHMVLNEYVFGTEDKFSFVTSLPFVLGVAASYLSGLYTYTVQCPERNAPGKYDLCGHSHQIWHLTVIMGIVFTYLIALTTFEQRKLNACPADSW